MATGTFKPTALDSLTNSLPTPAPAGPYTDALSAFNGDIPNGTWQLWVNDQASGDSGTIASGWTLRIASVVPPLTNGPNPDLSPLLQQTTTQLAVGEGITYTATVYNNGPAAANSVKLTDTLPALLTFGNAQTTAGTVTNAGNTVTATIGTLASGQNAVVTIVAVGVTPGTGTNTVNVSLTGTENSTTNNSASASITVGQPNLTPVQPPGWSSPAVVSTGTGTTTDSVAIAPGAPLFMDLAFTNSGTTPARSYFDTEIYVDGALRRSLAKQVSMAPGDTERQLDLSIGSFGPGAHLVQVKVDALGDVPESNETDNVFTRTFTVQGPNLALVKPTGWSAPVVVSKEIGTNIDSPSLNATDPLFLDRAVMNNGALPSGSAFTTELYVDGVLRTTWTTPSGFAANAQDVIQDFPLGLLSAGVHTLRLVTDASGAVAEMDETDNESVKTIVVNGVPTMTGLANQTIVEDGTTGPLPFTVGDSETAAGALSISVSSSNPAVVPAEGITVSGNGASRFVTVTPAPDQFGSSTITVSVSDGSGGITRSSFVVQVAPVNDAPSFNQGPAQTLFEDAGPQTVAGWATGLSAGPGNESTQTLDFLVTTDRPGLFAIAPAIAPDGTLSFTPAADDSGSATVTVRLHDSGGTANAGSIPAQRARLRSPARR